MLFNHFTRLDFVVGCAPEWI